MQFNHAHNLIKKLIKRKLSFHLVLIQNCNLKITRKRSSVINLICSGQCHFLIYIKTCCFIDYSRKKVFQCSLLVELARVGHQAQAKKGESDKLIKVALFTIFIGHLGILKTSYIFLKIIFRLSALYTEGSKSILSQFFEIKIIF